MGSSLIPYIVKVKDTMAPDGSLVEVILKSDSRTSSEISKAYNNHIIVTILVELSTIFKEPYITLLNKELEQFNPENILNMFQLSDNRISSIYSDLTHNVGRYDIAAKALLYIEEMYRNSSPENKHLTVYSAVAALENKQLCAKGTLDKVCNYAIPHINKYTLDSSPIIESYIKNGSTLRPIIKILYEHLLANKNQNREHSSRDFRALVYQSIYSTKADEYTNEQSIALLLIKQYDNSGFKKDRASIDKFFSTFPDNNIKLNMLSTKVMSDIKTLIDVKCSLSDDICAVDVLYEYVSTYLYDDTMAHTSLPQLN